MPTGARHAPCATHVPHAYPSNGWLCIDDEPGRADAMRAFADHLVAAAAEHHTLELERSAARPADGSHARWDVPIRVEDGHPVVEPVCRSSKGYCDSSYPVHLHRMGGPAPERSTEDRAAVARMSAELYARKGRPAPVVDQTVEPVAPEPVAPAKSRKRRTVVDYSAPMPAGFVVSDPFGALAEPAPDEIGSAEHLAESFRGFARDMIDSGRELGILAEPIEPAAEPVQNVQPELERSAGHLGYTWTLEGGLCEVYAVGSSVCRAPLSSPVQPGGTRSGREWWPVAYATMYQPDTYATVELASAAMAASGPIASADAPAAVLDAPAPVVGPATICEHGAYADLCITCNPAEPETVQPAPAVLAPVLDVDAQNRADMAEYIATEPVAPVLTIVHPSSRPTCARCGQTFRQSGAGAEWHRVNRPDCAAGARPTVLAAV
jgi:hypothetical protein